MEERRGPGIGEEAVPLLIVADPHPYADDDGPDALDDPADGDDGDFAVIGSRA